MLSGFFLVIQRVVVQKMHFKNLKCILILFCNLLFPYLKSGL